MEKLKKIREEHGYSYALMARLLKISKPFYWQIENEHRKLSYEMAFKIAVVFKTTPDNIFLEYFQSKQK